VEYNGGPVTESTSFVGNDNVVADHEKDLNWGIDVAALQQNLLRQAGLAVDGPIAGHAHGQVYSGLQCAQHGNGSFNFASQHTVYSSPDRSSHRTAGSQGTPCVFSPPRSGTHTEPRNYAPRTSGMPIFNEPPPKFSLGVVAYGSTPQLGLLEQYPAAKPNYAVRPLQSPPHEYAVVPFTQTSAVQCSPMLRMLLSTPTGLPSFSTAMQPELFPFIEGARQAKPANFGVVKLKNVRRLVLTFVGVSFVLTLT
jgi:hypothetical protein